MFATGPANNCALEMLSTDGYATIATLKGMEQIRTLEIMLDLEILNFDASGSDVQIIGDSNSSFFAFIDVDYNGLTSTPMSGLRACVNRNTQKTATPGDTTPDFSKRMTLWLKDNQSTVTFRVNGSSGTGVTYTATEAASKIVSPAGPITLLNSGTQKFSSRLYEAGIRVNGKTDFHVRPRLYMGDTATPGTVPDLSGYGNNLTVFGTYGTSYRYVSSWSKQIPYSGRETAA